MFCQLCVLGKCNSWPQVAGLPLQVGHLGAQYREWVQKPVSGQPRFFQSSSAEAISKTPW